MKKEQLRNSLRSIRHSYKNEEPEENQTFTFKLKTAFGQKIQTLTQNIKNFGQNLKKRKEKRRRMKPPFMVNMFYLVQFIYYIHISVI